MTRKFIIYFFCRGNSAKASSGMNGVPTASQHMHGISDSKLQFMEDTITSGGSLADRHLVARLVEDSASAIDWIEQQGVPLRVVSQCGGHSCPRTHRIAPDENGRATPVGWGIMSALQRKILGLQAKPFMVIMQFSTSLPLRLTDWQQPMVHGPPEMVSDWGKILVRLLEIWYVLFSLDKEHGRSTYLAQSPMYVGQSTSASDGICRSKRSRGDNKISCT
jgi:hypothetical protein